MNKLLLSDLNPKGKKVLMRVDLNVPMDKEGNILDNTRITASLPSIRYVLDHGGSLILMSHLGRPKGTVKKELSLAPCAKELSRLLGKNVIMAPDCVGKEVETLAKQLKPGEILLLENLRFHPEEEKPDSDPSFAKKLASFGDVYVNDAFGNAHRAHSSTGGITKYFPGKSAAGFLIKNETDFLEKLVQNPEHPFYALIGGAKISGKIGILKSLLKKVDKLLIGGGMAYTFFKAQGISIGDSIHEDDFIEKAKEILLLSKEKNVPILLPEDVVIANKITKDAEYRIIDIKNGIPPGFQGVDIGPKTIAKFEKALSDAKTVFWNGPMGVFEINQFAKGTNAIAQTLAELKATTVVGGGESVAAVDAAGVASKITHLSTGGGATLEFLEHGMLPGIECLTNK